MKNIRLMRPYISFNEIKKDFSQIFESGIFTRGKFLENFRNNIKNFLKVKNVFLMTSATTSLSMCLKLLKIGKSDEVIISDFSWPATANVVEDLGAKPVFVDCDDTFCMNINLVEKKITKKTKAIVPVHFTGYMTDMPKLIKISKK